MLRSSRPRSSTMPVAGSGMPRTVNSARHEWPWISSLAAPSVVPGSACAASKRNDFVNSHISRIQFLSDTERFVGLQAEPPLRMAQTIVDRARGVLDHIRSVHRLQREALEGKIDKGLWRCIRLRINQLEFMTSAYHEVCAGFGADANPVHAPGWIDRSIGLDADFETTAMQRIDKGLVHLQQRLAASQYRVTVCAGSGPLRGNGIGELPGRGIAAAQRAVGSDKIGVAKPARRRGAVLLAAAPEIAACEPAKHRRAAGVCAFALQGQKDFFNSITHWVCSAIAVSIYRGALGNANMERMQIEPNSALRPVRSFGSIRGTHVLQPSRLAVKGALIWLPFKYRLAEAAARCVDGKWFSRCRSLGISSSAGWQRMAYRSALLDPATPRSARR